MGLTDADRDTIVKFMVGQIGLQYDLKNIFDLMRYLLPTPPVPRRFRRKLIAFGSGEPTKAICSSLIAQAFQSVRYPILPRYGVDHLKMRHWTHFMPRDFDLSPYFSVVKPTLAGEFDYLELSWQDAESQPVADQGGIAETGEEGEA